MAASDALDTRVVNALLPHAAPQVGAVPNSMRWLTKLFRRLLGGLWVGGNAVLTSTELVFTPNALNSALHQEPENLHLRISLEDITGLCQCKCTVMAERGRYSSRRASPFAGEEIVALSSCKIVSIAKGDLHAAMAKHPQIANAMHTYAAVEYAVLNAWLVSLGRRDAFERVAHLLCELQHRLDLDGAVSPNSFYMPLTQSDFADALGLSTVHVHRKFRALRRDRLIKLTSRSIEILDLPLLKASAYFDPSYLEHTCEPAMQAGLS